MQIHLADRSQTAKAADIVAAFGLGKLQTNAETGEVSLATDEGEAILAEVVRRLDSAGVTISNIALRQPTLDDVFLALTGSKTQESLEDSSVARSDRRGILRRRSR